MENNSIDNQINNLMQERSQGFNDYTNSRLESRDYLKGFNEKYYLRNDTPRNLPSTYNASGRMNDDLENTFENNLNGEEKKTIKQKALELESLIVDALVRENYDDAKMLFNTLNKMNNKNNDDNVKDIFLRVQDSMPKKMPTKIPYSYQNNKNNFSEVLDAMSNLDNVSAYNDNQCMSKLGEMWDTCDKNICSDKCKSRILDAYRQSKDDECSDMVTSSRDGKDVTMKDDIKNIIIERLKYCRRIQDLENNDDSISYSDLHDLKNKTIEDIRKTVKLANLHYHNCQSKAEAHISKDPKLTQIVNMVSELDLTKLNLEKLQELRSNLNLLPSCDKIRYDEQQQKREKSIKDGIRIGKYVIPQDSDYYRQLQEQGKENPTIYKDLVSGKDYFYDAFSKTLTGIKYPETRKFENITDAPVEAPSIPPADTNLENIDMEKLLGLDELEKVPVESVMVNEPLESPVPSHSDAKNETLNSSPSFTNNVEEVLVKPVNNILNLKPTEETTDNDTSLIFGLDLNSLLGYILILLVILAVLYVTVEMIQNK